MENRLKRNKNNRAIKRRFYEQAFKQHAVAHWKSSGKTGQQVASELGIRANLLYKWNRVGGLSGRVGKNRMPENKNALEFEVLRLSKELARVTEQCDVLKRVVALFSAGQSQSSPLLNV